MLLYATAPALSIGFLQIFNWQFAIFVFLVFAPFFSRFLNSDFYFCAKTGVRFLALLRGLRRFLQKLPFAGEALPSPAMPPQR